MRKGSHRKPMEHSFMCEEFQLKCEYSQLDFTKKELFLPFLLVRIQAVKSKISRQISCMLSSVAVQSHKV